MFVYIYTYLLGFYTNGAKSEIHGNFYRFK